MIRYTSLAVFLILISIACRKQDNPVNELPDYSGPARVNFNNYISEDEYWGYLKYNVEIVNEWVDIPVEVKLSNTTSPAKGPVKIRLIKNDANIFDYNTEAGV